MQSDVVIFLSPVKYGCYSVAIRRVFDRLLPNLLPFFHKVKKRNNEVHHLPRYKKYPQMIVIGYNQNITKSEEETFKALADANAVNFILDQSITYVCRQKDEIEACMGSLKQYFYERQVKTV